MKKQQKYIYNLFGAQGASAAAPEPHRAGGGEAEGMGALGGVGLLACPWNLLLVDRVGGAPGTARYACCKLTSCKPAPGLSMRRSAQPKDFGYLQKANAQSSKVALCNWPNQTLVARFATQVRGGRCGLSRGEGRCCIIWVPEPGTLHRVAGGQGRPAQASCCSS